MENILENMTEETTEEMDLADEEKIENFMRGLAIIGFKYAELETEEERNEFIKNKGDDFYQVLEKELMDEECDDDDKHDGRVLAEEIARFVGNLISRTSEKGKSELRKHCFTDED